LEVVFGTDSSRSQDGQTPLRKKLTVDVFWWTRSQRIRTVGALSFEAHLLEIKPPPTYQRIASRAYQLDRLGLSHRRIAEKLGVTGKTVTKAVSWHRSMVGGDQGLTAGADI
jgi:hypothetical protein